MKKILFAAMILLYGSLAHANFTLHWTDEQAGVSYPDSYWVPYSATTSDKEFTGYYQVFASSSSFNSNKKALRTFRIFMDRTNPNFDANFSASAITGDGRNPQIQMEKYVLSFDTFTWDDGTTIQSGQARRD